MTKCEICEQEILLRLYNNHMLRAHRPKPDKEDEQAALVDVDGNRSFGRGSRTAAQKYVNYHVQCHAYVRAGIEELLIPPAPFARV